MKNIQTAKRTSLIFTVAEYKSLTKRQNGLKSDKTGIYASRVKPKIIEILEHWFPQEKLLQKLVAPVSNTKSKRNDSGLVKK